MATLSHNFSVKTDKQSWRQRVKDHLSSASSPLIVVLGPTASGKTAFSITLAQWLETECRRKAEVVNADSRQLYRFMGIGTAKITEEEMQGIPHHLLGVFDPDEEVTAGRYQTMARKAIDEIHTRGNVPLLVGGSMLYVSSVIDGLTLGPVSDPEHRERLIAEFNEDDGETLYKRLQSLDPETAATIDPKNAPRLIRAVEICETTGAKKSQTVPHGELRSKDAASGYDLLIFGIMPERGELMKRIDQRTEAMIRGGWIDEVQSLLDEGYDERDPGMKAAGYKEIMQFLREGDSDIDGLTSDIAKKTRNYAKRQISWWRGDGRIVWT